MKKVFTFVLALVMVMCLFAGCCSNCNTQSENSQVALATKEEPSFATTDLVTIPGYEYLVYSINSRTVYYFYSGKFMAPYLLNGHTCEYVNGEVVEVIPTVRIEDVTF